MASRYGNGGNGHGRRVIGDDAPLEEPMVGEVEKKKRTYDPQDRRMRRLGNYEAGLAVGGAAAGGVGVHGVRQDSKKLEGLTVRGKPTKPDTKAIHVLGSKKPPVLVSRRNAALLATGGAGLAGAGSLRRYANGDGGRRWH